MTMTARDVPLKLRQQVVLTLKAAADLTTITTASRVYGEQPPSPPTRPFVRHGVGEATPNRSSCWNGKTVDFTVHAFSQETFTDQVHAMNDAIDAALDNAVLDLGDGVRATIVLQSSTVVRDAGDVNAWHGVSRFRATV